MHEWSFEIVVDEGLARAADSNSFRRSRRARYGSSARVGTALEPEADSGLTHTLEHPP